MGKVTKTNSKIKNCQDNTHIMTLEDRMSSCQNICHPGPTERQRWNKQCIQQKKIPIFPRYDIKQHILSHQPVEAYIIRYSEEQQEGKMIYETINYYDYLRDQCINVRKPEQACLLASQGIYQLITLVQRLVL